MSNLGHERARCERELEEKLPDEVLDMWWQAHVECVLAGYPPLLLAPDAVAELTYRTVLVGIGLTMEQVMDMRDVWLRAMNDAERIRYFDAAIAEEKRYKPVWDKKSRKKVKTASADPLASMTNSTVEAKPKRGGKRKPVSKDQGSLF